MPVRMVSDDELENQQRKSEENGIPEVLDVEVVRKACEEAVGEELNDEGFEVLTLCAPALSLASSDGEITEDELYAIADTAVFARFGEEAYEKMTDEEVTEHQDVVAQILGKIFSNYAAETQYGSLEETLIMYAGQLMDEEGEDGIVTDFVFFTLREVANAKDELSENEVETLQLLCDALGFNVDDIFEDDEA